MANGQHPQDTFQYPDYSLKYGYGSPAWDREWSLFQQQRDSLLAEATARLRAAEQLPATAPPPPGLESQGANWRMPFTDLFASMQPGGRITPPSDLTHSQYNDLLGAAQFYGIADAEAMHPDQLQLVVQARRAGMAQDRAQRFAEGQLGFGEQAIESVQQTLAAMGVGPTQAIIDAVQNVPFLGQALARTETIQDADAWLSMVKEGFRSNLSESDTGWNIASGLGEMTGYALGAAAIIRGLGVVGKAPVIGTSLGAFWGGLNAIQKGALIGLGVGVVMEGGNPGEVQIGPEGFDVARRGTAQEGEVAVPLKYALPALETGAGAAFGVIEHFLAGVLKRAQNSFGTRAYPRETATITDQPRLAEAIPEAEFEAIAVRELPPGRPLLGPGQGGGAGPALPPGQGALPPGGSPPTAPSPALPPAATAAQAAERRALSSVDEYMQTAGIPPEMQQNDQVRSLIQELIEQNQISRRMAEMDPLTDLGNLRALHRALPTAETDPGTAVVVFDARGFKAVNDRFGHLEGDEALLSFANAMQQAADEYGFPLRGFRQGGDEFSAIVPKEHGETFRARVVELSRREYTDGTVTHLDGWVADDFATADAQLMAFKESVRDPSRRVGVQGAIGEANALSKHTALVESPGLPVYASKPRFDDYDVATALVHKAPGETSVLRGVGDVANTIRRMVQGAVEGGIGPQDFRIVQMGDRTDILIRGDKGLSNKLVDQYKRFGMFSGQRGIWRGTEVVIEEPGAEFVGLRVPGSSEVTLAPAAEVMPGNRSITSAGAPQAYQDLKSFVGQTMTREANKAGIPVPPWDSDATITQLPRLIEEFLSKQGITSPVERATWRSLFANEWTAEFKGMLPEELVFTRQVQAEAAREVAQAVVQGRMPIHAVEDMAASKGLRFIPETTVFHGTTEGRVDLSRGGPIHVGTRRAAEERVAQVSEELATRFGETPASAVEQFGLNIPRERIFGLNPGETPLRDINPDIFPQDAEAVAQLRAQGYDAVAYINDIEDPGSISYYVFDSGRLTRNTGGGEIVDQLSDMRVPVENEQAAIEFIRNFERETPDFTPGGAVDEFTENVPGNSAGSLTPGMVYEQADRAKARTVQLMARDVEEFERAVDEAIGGGGSQIPPPPPPGGGLPGPGETGGGELPGPSPTLGEQMEAARERLGAIERMLDSAILRYGAPMRRWVQRVDNELTALGVDTHRLYAEWDEVVTGRARAHNEAEPWLDRATNVIREFRRRYRRDGTVATIEEIGEPGSKLRAMQSMGYTPAEIEAQNALRPLFDDLHRLAGETGPINYIFDYLPHLRLYQARGVPDPYGLWERDLPGQFKWFAREMRMGEVQVRQMDIGELTTRYIRGLFFERNVADPYNRMVQRWSDPRIPRTISTPILSWLETVKTGVTPQYDVAIQGVRQVLNSMGVPVTNNEIRGLWNFVFANMYRSYLGLRPDVIFRDSIHPTLGGARLGLSHMRKAYTDFFKNDAARNSMWERALEHGWIERHLPQVISAEVFTQPAMTPSGNPAFGPVQQGIREGAARVGDLLYALTPKYLRGGLQGTWVDPIHFYGELGVFNRLIAGEIGWNRASAALARRQRVFQESGEHLSLEQVLEDSGATLYDEAVVRRAREILSSGDEDAFLGFMAREAANSQFRYGQIEQPVGVREAGQSGKIVMQLGTFTNQYLSYMKEGLTNGRVLSRVGFGLRYGALQGAIALAGAKLGWDFSNWMWHKSATFYGSLGPLTGAAATSFRAAGGAGTALVEGEDAYVTPEQQRAMETFGSGRAFQNVVETLNPYAAGIRTFTNYGDIVGSANPVEQAARLTLTGEAGIGPTWERFFQTYMPQEMTPQSAQRGVEFQTAPVQKNSFTEMQPAQRRQTQQQSPDTLPDWVLNAVPPEVRDTLTSLPGQFDQTIQTLSQQLQQVQGMLANEPNPARQETLRQTLTAISSDLARIQQSKAQLEGVPGAGVQY